MIQTNFAPCSGWLKGTPNGLHHFVSFIFVWGGAPNVWHSHPTFDLTCCIDTYTCFDKYHTFASAHCSTDVQHLESPTKTCLLRALGAAQSLLFETHQHVFCYFFEVFRARFEGTHGGAAKFWLACRFCMGCWAVLRSWVEPTVGLLIMTKYSSKYILINKYIYIYIDLFIYLLTTFLRPYKHPPPFFVSSSSQQCTRAVLTPRGRRSSAAAVSTAGAFSGLFRVTQDTNQAAPPKKMS